MTNERIILLQRIELLRNGLIGSKGTREFTDYRGRTFSYEMPEEIYTEGAWRKRGYKIRPGEQARARFPIWKYEIDHSARHFSRTFYMSDMNFFTEDQVMPITN